MPIESTIVPSERLVLTKSWGTVTFEEVIANLDRMLADPDFSPDYDQLAIHTQAESFTGTNEQAAALGRRKIFSSRSINVHVASSDRVYGLLRMMGTYHELENKAEFFEVFRDEESARQWLSEMRAKRETMRSE